MCLIRQAAVAFVSFAALLVGAGDPVIGQAAMSHDEQAIRQRITDLTRTAVDLRTADSIFFSGVLTRPFIRGQGKPEPTTRGQTVVAGSDRVETRVRRIEIAAGGDMAYEFSDGTIRRLVRGPDGREEPATLENSSLRVWRKIDGRWLVAAHFSAPHGDRR